MSHAIPLGEERRLVVLCGGIPVPDAACVPDAPRHLRAKHRRGDRRVRRRRRSRGYAVNPARWLDDATLTALRGSVSQGAALGPGTPEEKSNHEGEGLGSQAPMLLHYLAHRAGDGTLYVNSTDSGRFTAAMAGGKPSYVPRELHTGDAAYSKLLASGALTWRHDVHTAQQAK